MFRIIGAALMVASYLMKNMVAAAPGGAVGDVLLVITPCRRVMADGGRCTWR